MKYFDKTFWKMSLGFMAVILVSLVLLISVKIYESRGGSSVSPEENIAHTAQ